LTSAGYQARDGTGMGEMPVTPEAPFTSVPMEVSIDDDGGVTVAPLLPQASRAASDDFDRNLAREMDEGLLSALGGDLIQGIEADLESRREWIDNWTKGMPLLGTKIEEMSGTKTNKRNISSLVHPLLLEAIVKAQGAARAELLPAAGPVKVRLRGNNTEAQDDLAQSLENDMNNYLTTVAREYYPDTDRGLFSLFYGGNWFRKVYMCPLRRRPVCESIDVSDLIVSQDAVDIDNAMRVTHRAMISPTLMRRMQIFGDWLDITLGTPTPDETESGRAKRELTGERNMSLRPEDQSFTIYETTTDIDPEELGFNEPDAPPGLPLPYVVTIEKDSRSVLCIRRGWRQGDDRFVRRQRFVHYGMVPSFGFLCLGYVHLLGNSTRALTAAWRLLCDAGMFSNFPGGVKLRGTRTSTNEVAPTPGEWVDVDGQGVDDLRKIMMPMPYKDPSMVFVEFMAQVAQAAKEMGGTVNLATGEGRTNIPVGTMMAMVEQATQVGAIVHKRLHTSQAREFELLKEVIAENPDALAAAIPRPDLRWRGKLEFDDIDLIPASDPNVPSQTHRVMLATALVQIAAENPDIYDKLAVHERAWRTVGVNDTKAFLHPQPPPGPQQPDPAAAMASQAQQIKAQADLLKAQTDAADSRRKAATEAVETHAKMQKAQTDQQTAAAQAAAKERLAFIEQETERMRLQSEMTRAQAQAAAAAAKTMGPPSPQPGVI